jgi:hypothetical protein
VKDDNIDDSIADHDVPGSIDALAPDGAESDAGYADEYALNDIGLALRLQSEMP